MIIGIRFRTQNMMRCFSPLTNFAGIGEVRTSSVVVIFLGCSRRHNLFQLFPIQMNSYCFSVFSLTRPISFGHFLTFIIVSEVISFSAKFQSSKYFIKRNILIQQSENVKLFFCLIGSHMMSSCFLSSIVDLSSVFYKKTESKSFY